MKIERLTANRFGRGAGMVEDRLTTVTERNKRTVWTVNTYAWSEAHFATFPSDLMKPCILAVCLTGCAHA